MAFRACSASAIQTILDRDSTRGTIVPIKDCLYKGNISICLIQVARPSCIWGRMWSAKGISLALFGPVHVCVESQRASMIELQRHSASASFRHQKPAYDPAPLTPQPTS